MYPKKECFKLKLGKEQEKIMLQSQILAVIIPALSKIKDVLSSEF